MKKLTEVIILGTILVVFLVGVKLAYGLAGSLEELKNETIGTDAYRTELENYTVLHNISILLESGKPAKIDTMINSTWTPLNGSYTFETEQLESIVKYLIKSCELENKGETKSIGAIFGIALSGTC